MIWNDLRSKGEYIFKDNSKLTQIHDIHKIPCYKFDLKYHPSNINKPEIIISEDHYILCDISKVKNKDLMDLYQPLMIPLESDYHIGYDKNGNFIDKEEITNFESVQFNEKHWWLNAKMIYFLLENKEKIRPVKEYDNNKFKYNKFTDWNYVGEKECFCISTDTGMYEVCGVINHNSVSLRNIIFHSLTHSDDIVLGLVDLKLSEFSRYKGVNRIVGVANNVLESVELLRVARECMYKRNLENAERGLTDFKDYVPTEPTNKIRIFGREFDENNEFNVKIGEEEKTMTAKEILEYVNSN